jgi:sarcosine oxidase gamma subunit
VTLTAVKSAVEMVSPEAPESVAVAEEVPLRTVAPEEALITRKASEPAPEVIMANLGFSVGR